MCSMGGSVCHVSEISGHGLVAPAAGCARYDATAAAQPWVKPLHAGASDGRRSLKHGNNLSSDRKDATTPDMALASSRKFANATWLTDLRNFAPGEKNAEKGLDLTAPIDILCRSNRRRPMSKDGTLTAWSISANGSDASPGLAPVEEPNLQDPTGVSRTTPARSAARQDPVTACRRT